MFYGNASKDVSVLGLIVAQRVGGEIHLKNLILVSGVLDHTCEMAGMLFARARHSKRAQGLHAVGLWEALQSSPANGIKRGWNA